MNTAARAVRHPNGIRSRARHRLCQCGLPRCSTALSEPVARETSARRGMVLLAVLIVVAMISLAGLSFVAFLSAEHKAVRVHGGELQMEHVLASGLELLQAHLALPGDAQLELGGFYDNAELFRDVEVINDPVAQMRGAFCVVSPRIEDGEVRGIRYGVENESARLHLAMVMQWEQKQPGAGRRALLNLPDITENIADALLDWMDADSQPRALGAEAQYYADEGLPFSPRNGVPASLEELLMVHGVMREHLFGSDVNFNRTLDPGEGATYAERLDTLESGGETAWASLLTVYSAERNLTPEGQPRINLNDADIERLHQRLTEAFDQRTADFVVAYRQFGPYQGPPLRSSPVLPEVDLTQPTKFRFASVLDVVGTQVRLYAPAFRSYLLLPSPFSLERPALAEQLPRVLEHLTLDAAPTIAGRVNILLAPQTVLACVPGMDESLISRILAGRPGPDEMPGPQFKHPTWLVTEGLVDLVRMKGLLPYITTGGDVYRAQIVGYYDRPGPFGRAEVVIDATGKRPRQLYYKDLRVFGRGYPPEVLALPIDEAEQDQPAAAPATQQNDQ